MKNLIKSLEERYTLNTPPDVATTVAQGLIQLSSGIYTEEERYIFELLQNAVDAHNSSDDHLNIKILQQDEYLVFMHNGEAFSERDIKGLCDIGNGNKAGDSKKIGYKGIGFKSVFMRSSCVTVESGGYCFKFDKSHWENYWDKNWQDKYGEKESDKRYLMPWQIIPIETKPPIRLPKSGYNVITYIQLDKSSKIADKITKLLANSQFLLFLNVANIRITYEQNGSTLNSVEKTTRCGEVCLSSNGQIQSKWLIYSNDKLKVPAELMEDINADINTPEKLKGAETFDLSFAIALGSDGKIKKVDRTDAVIYTYLPTTYKFGTEGFPFLVNANFITDAGRQQLQKDSVWNKLIFSNIPSEFLKWIAQISTTYSNYYEILPKKTYGNENTLEKVFAEKMKEAIETINFIPQLANPSVKLLAKEAVMDRMGITESISKEVFVSHINRTYNEQRDKSGLIAPVWKGYKILEEYGVFIFSKDKIKALLEDYLVFKNITTEDDIKLISFLYDFQNKNREESNEFNIILSDTKFLLDEDKTLKCPSELFFPTPYKEENSLAANVPFLHIDIHQIVEERGWKEWLSKLGVNTLSNLSFVEYLSNNKDYITTENAIEIGRFIFQISQKEDLFGSLSEYVLCRIKFLTTKRNLYYADNLYLSAKYKPELNLEPIFDEDIFVSEEYCKDESVAEWKAFLLKMGIKEDISEERASFHCYLNEVQRYDESFFDCVKEAAQRYRWVAFGGWELDSGDYFFNVDKIIYDTFSFIDKCDKYNFSKLVFSRLFRKYTPENIKSNSVSVSGHTGFYDRAIAGNMLTKVGCEINHFRWVLKNCTIMPTVKQDCRLAKDVYSNAIPQINDIAGTYLPILDVDPPIDEDWQKFLGLKSYLTIEDYLSLLAKFSNDVENLESNKSRISLIYQKLADSDVWNLDTNKTFIKEWAKKNKILCRDNTFYPPQELNYITLDGFGSANQVFIGSPSNRKKVIELLGLMGVRIITEDNIHPDFAGSETESRNLKVILTENISPLALISAGEHVTEIEYNESKERIQRKLDNSRFYHCDTIKLTYGNNDDVIERHTFAKDNEFYYIGDLRPANVEPLLTPLCKYLEIEGKERELFMLMIEDYDGIYQNLKDKGYNVKLLEKNVIPTSGTFIPIKFNPRTESQMDRDRITGFKGEIIVYEKLRSFGYQPVCPTISEDNFSGATIVSMFGKTYYCKDNFNEYDMHFDARNGTKVFVEVKATTLSKEVQNNIPISYTELSMIEEHQDNEKEMYVIVRVFGVDETNSDIYCFDGQILDNKTFETK